MGILFIISILLLAIMKDIFTAKPKREKREKPSKRKPFDIGEMITFDELLEDEENE